jgi:hypothetical protein
MATTIVTTEGRMRGGWEGKLSNLYAVLVTERTNIIVYEDGHFRVRFNETGNIIFAEKNTDTSLDECVKALADKLADSGRPAQIHIVPVFANEVAAKVWFESLGLSLTDAGREELRQLGLSD